MRGSIGSPTLCSLINLPVMVAQLGAAGPGQQVAQVSDTQLRLGFVEELFRVLNGQSGAECNRRK